MSYDDRKVRRINTAMQQNDKLHRLREEIVVYMDENTRHARSESTSDYLDLLKSEYRIAKLLADALQWDTWEQQLFIVDEARNECDYDLVEGCFLDDNGEPRHARSLPPGYSDYVYETRRDAK